MSTRIFNDGDGVKYQGPNPTIVLAKDGLTPILVNVDPEGNLQISDSGGSSGIQFKIEKDQPNGYPSLDSNGKIPDLELPRIAITDTYVVGTTNAMLALDAQVGDVAIRTDVYRSFILQYVPALTLSNWQELLTPPDVVQSVNSKIGTVLLTTDDISSIAQANQYVSVSEKSAISGTNGIPGSTNKFVTDSDSRMTDSRNPSGSASGDLTGTFPSPTLTTTGITSGTYGDSTHVVQLTVDSKGRLSFANNITIAGTAPTGPAGGDLAGTYPSPILANSGVTSGIYGSSTYVPVINIDSKGRIISASDVAISASGGITVYADASPEANLTIGDGSSISTPLFAIGRVSLPAATTSTITVNKGSSTPATTIHHVTIMPRGGNADLVYIEDISGNNFPKTGSTFTVNNNDSVARIVQIMVLCD